ncbi:hypothetical protein [Botryobacter ruber]|uniref:hypothetical protein n=1 Tax=Botryobacter ruber TaxID=2171629 RepID=UPI000F646986|nr:hypothetical protein [Botryobacter ruber]
MNKLLNYWLIVSGLLSIGILVLSLFLSNRLLTSVFGFVGINSLFIVIAAAHTKLSNASRVFGAYLLLYMFVYIWINFDLYHFWIFRNYMKIKDIFFLSPENFYFYRYLLRNALIVLITCYSVYLLIRGGKFSQIYSTRLFKAAMTLLGGFLVAELPIYDIHGDIAGNAHGHSYWYGLHMH